MINHISAIQPTIQPKTTTELSNDKTNGTSFAELLKQSLETVNNAQIQSDQMTQDFIVGKPVELHDMMIAGEKASILLQTTIEVRNKVVEAYQEVMRMQV